MTATITSAPPDVRPHPRRAQRIALATLIPLGPLSVAILRGILPYYTTDDSSHVARAVAAHQTAESAVLWLVLIASLTLVPGTIAIGIAVARRMPKLGSTALILSVAGFSVVPVIALTDYIALAAVRSGATTGEVAHLLDQLQKQPTVAVGGVVFVLGHILGVALLGIAAWRAGLVPMWAGLVLAVSQPFHAVFAVVVPNHALDASAWALTAVGYFVCARAVSLRDLKDGDSS